MQVSMKAALGILLVTACCVKNVSGISCYNGEKSSIGSFITSVDITKEATLSQNCDYCLITRSSSISPVATDSISWKCEQSQQSTGGCLKSLMKADSQELNQYHCQCCEDNCNSDMRCQNDGLTAAGAAGTGSSVSTDGPISCYSGNVTKLNSEIDTTSFDITKVATLTNDCDYCSFVRMKSSAPVKTEIATWKCEKFTENDGTDGKCFKSVVTAKNTQIDQYTCKCCDGSCNNGLQCKNDGLVVDGNQTSSGRTVILISQWMTVAALAIFMA